MQRLLDQKHAPEPLERILNPIFSSSYDLSMATFYSLHLLIRTESERCDHAGKGEIIGQLNQDLGPLIVNDYVKLTNNQDRVELYLWKNNGWQFIYQFLVILEPPLIITSQSDKTLNSAFEIYYGEKLSGFHTLRNGLSRAVVYALCNLMEFIENQSFEYDIKRGNITGYLNQNLGPALPGECVKLTIDKDFVSLYRLDNEEDQEESWALAFKFRAALQPPLIVEKKTRAK